MPNQPNPMSPDFCPAFSDHQHRFAFSYGAEWNCACAVAMRDADHADVLTVKDKSEIAALPFMLGYSVEDYPMHLWPEVDARYQQEVDLYAIESDAEFEKKYHCSRDEMYKQVYPDTFFRTGKVHKDVGAVGGKH